MDSKEKKKLFARLILELNKDNTSKIYNYFASDYRASLKGIANGNKIVTQGDRNNLNSYIQHLDDIHCGYITDEWNRVLEQHQ